MRPGSLKCRKDSNRTTTSMESPKFVKLKPTLYKLRQYPPAFWLYLTKTLESCGLKQSKLDHPCLFIGERVTCIIYVDDLLFWSPKEEYIYDLGEQLRAGEVELKLKEEY